ncbi:succinate dehydrogenase cytochrome b subunit [Spelaeicoccus albus]|uniref:Succinate dehydrogenase / fumarate reductase cytochrome b subunit n=1 Tax=Spelaeicoccus albus TaxID=1280376 RepID=A0A7Z0D2E5_9MICO|nr:succinate dehydrogenase cytochrome b subunit [Spelaeicoccus albus]NYI67631.1 succinate dehydrogenase / fumarate reductase cytochrome b subunit [Spelaeicoccus albus]
MALSAPRRAGNTRRLPLWRSSAALHAAMAVSGLVMILFLLAHAYGNYKVFAGRETFDGYSHFLLEMGEPIVQYSVVLWVIRIVLIVSVIVHIASATVLWKRMRRATGGRGSTRYRTTKNRRGVQRTYSSFTMRWGGVVIGLFVVYHLLHLSADNVIHPGGASTSPYERMTAGFSIWWVLASYTVALIALGLHLRHGFWSALASLGANTSPTRRRQFNVVASVLAGVITVGFLVPPFSIYFGGVGQ